MQLNIKYSTLHTTNISYAAYSYIIENDAWEDSYFWFFSRDFTIYT